MNPLNLALNKITLICLIKNSTEEQSLKIIESLLKDKEGEEILKSLCETLGIDNC